MATCGSTCDSAGPMARRIWCSTPSSSWDGWRCSCRGRGSTSCSTTACCGPGCRRSPGRNDAQLFGQSRTLRITQLLGFDCSMVHLDLAAPGTHSVQSQRFSFRFAGLEAQPQPVAEIVQCGEPTPSVPQTAVTRRWSGSVSDARCVDRAQGRCPHAWRVRAGQHRNSSIPRTAIVVGVFML